LDLLILALLVLLGLVAGAASGLFGVGGGIVLVPGLIILAGLSFRDAVAASLLFIVLVSPVAVWRHWTHKNVNLRQGAFLGMAGIIGVLLGELVGRHVTDRTLILGFCAVLVVASRHLAYGSLPRAKGDSALATLAVGVLGGFVAKLFGIGGGIIVVPALVFLGLPIHLAIGTSLVSVFLNALVSTGVNLTQGRAWAIWALAPAAGALAGVQLGVRAAVRTHGDGLKRLFAILLLLVALDLARRAL
jgi:uncharacterized membrane protein YfcA